MIVESSVLPDLTRNLEATLSGAFSSIFCLLSLLFFESMWLSAVTDFGSTAPNTPKPIADCSKKEFSLIYGKCGKWQQQAVDIQAKSQVLKRLFYLKTLCQLSRPKFMVEPWPTHRQDNHRMGWVGRNAKDHVVPIPLPWSGNLPLDFSSVHSC